MVTELGMKIKIVVKAEEAIVVVVNKELRIMNLYCLMFHIMIDTKNRY